MNRQVLDGRLSGSTGKKVGSLIGVVVATLFMGACSSTPQVSAERAAADASETRESSTHSDINVIATQCAQIAAIGGIDSRAAGDATSGRLGPLEAGAIEDAVTDAYGALAAEIHRKGARGLFSDIAQLTEWDEAESRYARSPDFSSALFHIGERCRDAGFELTFTERKGHGG